MVDGGKTALAADGAKSGFAAVADNAEGGLARTALGHCGNERVCGIAHAA